MSNGPMTRHASSSAIARDQSWPSPEDVASRYQIKRRPIMRAHQIMTRDVITVRPDTTIEEAAKLMLRNHISGLPVTDAYGELVGVASESDFLRRSEIGTGRKRPAWLQFLLGPGRAATDFVRERGRKVEDVMTQDVITVAEETPLDELVRLMEKNDIKRLPVMRGKA